MAEGQINSISNYINNKHIYNQIILYINNSDIFRKDIDVVVRFDSTNYDKSLEIEFIFKKRDYISNIQFKQLKGRFDNLLKTLDATLVEKPSLNTEDDPDYASFESEKMYAIYNIIPKTSPSRLMN